MNAFCRPSQACLRSLRSAKHTVSHCKAARQPLRSNTQQNSHEKKIKSPVDIEEDAHQTLWIPTTHYSEMSLLLSWS